MLGIYNNSALSQPKISVALCTYNGEAYLEQQLFSIAAQTITSDIELIVCDDCSTDRTAEIVKSFAESVSFPVFWRQNEKQLGVLQNFLRAFELCRGECIAYCDQDDVWRSDKLELCLQAFNQAKNIALVSHFSVLTNAGLQPSGVVLPRFSGDAKWLRPHFPLSYWGFGHQMVFSSSIVRLMRLLVDQRPPGLESYYANLDRLIPLCAGIFGGIVVVDEGLTYFRRHSDSVSPAGKKDSSSDRPLSRGRQRQHYLNELMQTMLDLKQFLEHERKSAVDIIPDQFSEEYGAHLNQLLQRLALRVKLFESTSKMDRPRLIWKAIAGGAYLSENRHGFGPRQFLLDLYAIHSISKPF